jgi:hypothetical protein
MQTFGLRGMPVYPSVARSGSAGRLQARWQGRASGGRHVIILCMDTETIDSEYEKLQTEFGDVAKTVQALAEKMQAAEKAGDSNATEWLGDLKQIAQDISDEQAQANTLLQAIHGFVSGVAQAQAGQPGQQPRGPLGGGMMGGMMGGGPFGGFLGGGFGQAMMMGGGVGLGQSLISSIFRSL